MTPGRVRAGARRRAGRTRAELRAGPAREGARAHHRRPQAFAYTFTSGYEIRARRAGLPADLDQQRGVPAVRRRRLADRRRGAGGVRARHRPAGAREPGRRTCRAGPRRPRWSPTRPRRCPGSCEDADGALVAHRRSTTPRGVDPTADLNVHTFDFTGVTAPGDRLRPRGRRRAQPPVRHRHRGLRAPAPRQQDVLLHQPQRHRDLRRDRPGLRPRGRPRGGGPRTRATPPSRARTSTTTPRRSTTSPGPATTRRTSRGGWYDAGDQGKYVVNGGIAVAQLMQEYERTKNAPSADAGALGDGTLRVPESGNGVPDLLDEARWELEWMLQDAGRPGRPLAGHGLPQGRRRRLDRAAARPGRRPPAAGALPAVHRGDAQPRGGRRAGRPAVRAVRRGFAAQLLDAAANAPTRRRKAHPDLYAPAPDATLDPNPGSGPYNDTDVRDESYWAAAELYLTTRAKQYRDDVLASPAAPRRRLPARRHRALGPRRLRWPAWTSRPCRTRCPTGRASSGPSSPRAEQYLAEQAANPFGQAYAPEGATYGWGSNSPILNDMQVIGTAYDLTGEARFRDGVARSMDYLFGRNALNLSYVTGYGDGSSENQHSRCTPTSSTPSCRTRRRHGRGRAELHRRVLRRPGRRAAVRGLPRPVLLHRRHRLVVDQRDHDQLERAAVVGGELPGRPGRRRRRADGGRAGRSATPRESGGRAGHGALADQHRAARRCDGWTVSFAFSGAQRLRSAAGLPRRGGAADRGAGAVTGRALRWPPAPDGAPGAARGPLGRRGASWEPELFLLDGQPVR